MALFKEKPFDIIFPSLESPVQVTPAAYIPGISRMIFVQKFQCLKALLHLFRRCDTHFPGIQLRSIIVNLQRLFILIYFKITANQLNLPVIKGIDS